MSKARAEILRAIKSKTALGNSNVGFKNVASDLLHATNEKPSVIAIGCFLSPHTIARVMDCEDNYRPQSETLERIFRYCNAEVCFQHVKITNNYLNKPKD